MKSEPSHELLEKVMNIADAKVRLPLQERGHLNHWGVYCSRKHRLGGKLLYVAGGQFDIKLDFIRKRDGSIHVNKYNSGDWELAINPTYNYAKFLMDEKVADREAPEFFSSAPQTLEERILLLEHKARQPEWLFYLFSLYIIAARFKDAEKALIKRVEIWPNVFCTHTNLGVFYMEALAPHVVTKFAGRLDWVEFHMDVKDLGYTYDHALGLAKHHIQEALSLAPKNDPEMQGILQAALAELRALEKPPI